MIVQCIESSNYDDGVNVYARSLYWVTSEEIDSPYVCHYCGQHGQGHHGYFIHKITRPNSFWCAKRFRPWPNDDDDSRAGEQYDIRQKQEVV